MKNHALRHIMSMLCNSRKSIVFHIGRNVGSVVIIVFHEKWIETIHKVFVVCGVGV